jgi:hypothetical protein
MAEEEKQVPLWGVTKRKATWAKKRKSDLGRFVGASFAAMKLRQVAMQVLEGWGTLAHSRGLENMSGRDATRHVQAS